VVCEVQQTPGDQRRGSVWRHGAEPRRQQRERLVRRDSQAYQRSAEQIERFASSPAALVIDHESYRYEARLGDAFAAFTEIDDQTGLALAEILALWTALAMTLAAFWRVRPLAGLLLVPYLGWVSFATALNGAIWWLNR